MFGVEGYGVIVTGGASGIGLGYAETLASHGARVTILDVDADRLDAMAHRRARDNKEEFCRAGFLRLSCSHWHRAFSD